MSRMRHAVFVAPFLAETTLRFVDAAASSPDASIHLVSQDPLTRVPPGLQQKLASHVQVPDATRTTPLVETIEKIGQKVGRVERLLGTLEQLQVPLGEVRDRLGIRGMRAGPARNFRDKSLMKTVLQEAGLPCAQHRLVISTEAAWEFARTIGYPIVVKPPAGAGARGTHRVDEEQALAACLHLMQPSRQHPLLLEQFITGEEHSFDSICLGGKLVWHSINRYFPTPLEVIEQPWIQWCVLSPREVDGPEWADITRTAAETLRALGMQTGLSHLEWFRREDGSVAISEVAARPPGAQFTTLASYAGDFDLYQAWARLMLFDEFDARPRPYAAGAAFLRGQGQGRVKAIHGIDEVDRELGQMVVESKLPRRGQSPTGSYEGEGYVIVRHPETQEVEKALARIVQLIRVDLA
jgi:biotin carboxylase